LFCGLVIGLSDVACARPAFWAILAGICHETQIAIPKGLAQPGARPDPVRTSAFRALMRPSDDHSRRLDRRPGGKAIDELIILRRKHGP
jgi:hypothetical protein